MSDRSPDSQGFGSGIPAALIAAFLFGITTPVSKLLLGETGPVILAGLLYLGAGAGLLVYRILSRQVLPRNSLPPEAPVRSADLPWLAGIVITGGFLGPVLLMTGLATLPAGTASLMLNGELAATTLLAVLLFHEPADRRITLSIILVLAGGIIISWDPDAPSGFSPGAFLILLACLAWGLDNNLTRKVADKDPVTIVIIKGLCAGTISLCIGLSTGEPLPPLYLVPAALAAGCLGYGLSILFFIRGLRKLGAARTGSLFATAPFIGLVASPLITGEVTGLLVIPAGLCMILGVTLMVTESHGHVHTHQSLYHEHRHSHDDGHHYHHHPAGSEPEHAHSHNHGECIHDHPHTPDIHHYHPHDPDDGLQSGMKEEKEEK
ncbi:MAG: DMT family transporter [Methanospirillum sp.]|nr:DMT family transporter [Methanospirillum sp.]